MIFNKTSDSNSNTDSLPVMEEIKELFKNKRNGDKDRRIKVNANKRIILREKTISPKYISKLKKKLRT